MVEIRIYETERGERPFADWLKSVDRYARSKVTVAVGRVEEGNTGALKSVGGGVFEIKISFGPGYRVYLGQQGAELVILLAGGTKKRQSDDISHAKKLWADYLAETRNERGK